MPLTTPASSLQTCRVLSFAALVVFATAVRPATHEGRASAQSVVKPEAKPGDAKTLPTVRFNHKDCKPVGNECRAAYPLDLDDGQSFLILIESTLPDDFTYDVAGIPAAAVEKATKQIAATRDTSFTQTHDKKYGGYVVTIRKKGVAAALPDAMLVISVRTNAWTASFAGGFPVSTLVDHVFSLHDTTVGTTKQYLPRREKDHEDKVSLATATFIHLRHNKWRSETFGSDFGLSFGLGIGGNTTYYIGPSLLFSNAGALTGGVVVGSRNDLPSGVSVDQLTTNSNALSTLAKRNDVGYFVGFSYSFLGGGVSDLQKPFKGADPAAAPAAAAAPKIVSSPGSLAVDTTDAKVGKEIVITVTLNRTSDMKTLVTATYDIEPTDTTLFSLAPHVQLTAVENGEKAQADVKAKLLKAAEKTPLSVKISGGGISEAIRLSSPPITIKP